MATSGKTLLSTVDKSVETRLHNTRAVTWKQLTVRIPVEVHRGLRIRAAEEDRSCAVIIEELIRQYLAGDGDHVA